MVYPLRVLRKYPTESRKSSKFLTHQSLLFEDFFFSVARILNFLPRWSFLGWADEEVDFPR